ncbi:MAG: polysaccharide biosynthesis protein [Methylococcaceae bacterium]|nr:MAG: polysaccharide biosynthesis protein [Methylococcaceae bacterium]
MHNFLLKLPRQSKRAIMLVSDLLLLPFALWSAFALRWGTLTPDLTYAWWLLIAAPLIAIPIFIKLGLYRAVIRYMDDKAAFAVLTGVTLATLLLVLVVMPVGFKGIPRSSFFIYWVIALLYIGGSRQAVRSYVKHSENRHGVEQRARVAIYGAGDAGVQLVMALRSGRDFQPVAFFDEKPDLHGCEICGVRVYAPDAFAKVLDKERFTAILLALPSVPLKRRQEIIRSIEGYCVPIKTIPGIVDLVSGKARIDEIRPVEIEDLLGRDIVIPEPALLARCIAGKSVMVSGAGGSIGAELCRQILQQNPKRLVLFDLSEFALYQIEQELHQLQAKLAGQAEIVAILGSVTDRQRLASVLGGFKVQTIYHAAAYKHVPLVEHNPIEGVRNNTFGTWHAAQAALQAGVDTFVLISTDKAVRPTNVMGASKRLAELVLQGLARQGGKTRFCMVRFGNVLGSSGSVAPLFRKQIQQGGPVTVTHPEVIRYFMTIPEASQLVLQAGAMGQGGDVFVLDMGKPVKIADLARRMIHLSGFQVRDDAHPDGDIEIVYTGLRPGEKLYEELLIGDNVSATEHPLIMRAQESELAWPELQDILDKLAAACDRFACPEVRRILLEAVDGYAPQCGICDHVWNLAGDETPALSG